MNIYNEYMGGLKIYSNQYFVRNKFSVYILVPSVDNALAFVSIYLFIKNICVCNAQLMQKAQQRRYKTVAAI